MRTAFSMGRAKGVLSILTNLCLLKSKRIVLRIIPILIVMTSSVYAQDVSVFQPTDGPSAPKFNDGQGITVGMKFRSTQAGYINGIRYYKAPGTTGMHIGSLWTNTGTKLGEVTFINETASGWQQALFSSSVTITANTTYLATYYSESGDYAATNPFFTQGVQNGPLRALAADEEGPNGIFMYSVAPAFPSSGFMSPNYWVDVVYSTTFMPDVTPPAILSVVPPSGSSGAAINAPITATFTETINPSTISSASFQLRDALNNVVPAFYNVAFNQAMLTPFSALTNSTAYTVTIKGGASGVKDASGNGLAGDYTWTFTTAGLPTPEGHGGPILVLGSAVNPFSRYASEILRAEGLNGFITKDISQTSAADLTNYDVVILGEMAVTPAQAGMLTTWVNAGGTLIAFKPSGELSSLLGIVKVTGTLANQYMKINTTAGTPGAGIVSETIQFHGESDLYTLNGATSLATLYFDAVDPMPYPAVTTRNVGANGGKAIAFTYDLARSIVYTRQGNPAWAGQKRDGTDGPIRSDDLFFGVNGDHWINFDKIDIPQADEQQRLLTNIILQSSLHRKPMPRFWFLPSGHKAAVVMTGDDHLHNGTTGQFNYFKTLGPNTAQDVADWKAIRATSFIYSGTMSNAAAAAFEAQGFELSLHVSTGCANFTPASFQSNVASQLSQFTSMYPGVPVPTTGRTHCITWSDWSSAAKVETQNGIRLDANYYYWPASWIQNHPGLFTGSGMPMRFADLDGTMIDCYQVTTQMTDESEISYGAFTNHLLDKALGAEGYYGVFTANMHTDSSVHSGANAIIASAIAHNVPVISARQLLTWLDGRNESYFGNTTWSNNVLTFTITTVNGARNLKAMLPYRSATGQLNSLTKDGSSLAFTVETIKGMQYAFFNAAAGTATYVANYKTGPVITAHPAPIAVCPGQPASFKSAASGSPAPTVQWQVSTNGTTWTNISAATNPNLTFTPVAADHNKQYRAVWTNTSGVTNSSAAVLTINPTPVLSGTLTANAVTSTLFSYIAASSTPGTSFTWTRAAVTGITNAAASGTGNIQETLVNTAGAPVTVTYVYKLTANGCVNTQNVVVTVSPRACTVNTSVVFNFNSNTIKKGRYIWFNSAFDPSGLGNGPVHFFVSNSKIMYRVNGQDVVLTVPDAQVRFDAAVSMNSASTQYVNNAWRTTVPLNGDGNVFLTGFSYLVPNDLPGNISNIRWTADISSDKPGVPIKWKWAAAVYSSFSGNAGLTVKPIDAAAQIFGSSLDEAGTPMNYRAYVIPGATGQGLVNIGSVINVLLGGSLNNLDILNYTGSYSSIAQISCNGSSIQSKGPAPVEVITELPAHSELPVVEGKLDVKAMPNPSSSYFTVIINGDDKTASIRVVDMMGRVVEQYENIRSGSVLRMGERWRGGMYMVEVIQGKERKVIKLIKAN